MLARKRVEPAIDEEILVDVGAVALDAESLRTKVANIAEAVVSVLRTGTRGVLWGTKRLEDALEVGAPLVGVLWVGDSEVDVLESIEWTIFTVDVVHDSIAAALA